MRQQVPLVLCFLFGVVIMVVEFSPHPIAQKMTQEVQQWGLIISPFALVLAVATLVRIHWVRIRRRSEYWQYSILVFLGLLVMVGIGIPFRQQHPVFVWLFDYVYTPMDATMFSMLAFFIASAAYRAFRARTLEATLLLVAALIVMIGNVPIGDFLWDKIVPFWDGFPSKARQWIMEIPNSAARRGIILGVSLGVISQSLRIILGIERSYLGSGGD